MHTDQIDLEIKDQIGNKTKLCYLQFGPYGYDFLCVICPPT